MFHVAKQFCKILKDFNQKLQFLCYPQKNAVSYLSFLVSVFEINNIAGFLCPQLVPLALERPDT